MSFKARSMRLLVAALVGLPILPALSKEGQYDESIVIVNTQWRDTGALGLSWQSKMH